MFCGHRDVFERERIKEKVKEILIYLIEKKNISVFLSGGMGEFDGLCESLVIGLKDHYKDIKLCLIIPYLTKNILNNPQYYNSFYDEIIKPDFGEDIFPKYAIIKRNRYMVDNSDYIISYVIRDFGGAYKTLKYAEKSNINIINIK